MRFSRLHTSPAGPVHSLLCSVCWTAGRPAVRTWSLQNLARDAELQLPLQVSVLWCFYNTSAPFLLLWHKLFHNKGLTLLVNFWALASSLIVLAIICIIWIILPTEFEYGQVCRICSPDSCCFSHCALSACGRCAL